MHPATSISASGLGDHGIGQRSCAWGHAPSRRVTRLQNRVATIVGNGDLGSTHHTLAARSLARRLGGSALTRRGRLPLHMHDAHESSEAAIGAVRRLMVAEVFARSSAVEASKAEDLLAKNLGPERLDATMPGPAETAKVVQYQWFGSFRPRNRRCRRHCPGVFISSIRKFATAATEAF